MKKLLLVSALLTGGLTQAQVWTENFSSVTTPALPTNWLQNNVDGLTPSSGVAFLSFGTKAWLTDNITVSGLQDAAAHGKVAVSTSSYNPAGTSNDWLISPKFTVPANSLLTWDGLSMANAAGLTDGYLVKISTTGGSTPADFATTLTTVANEDGENWMTRSVNLSSYSGQSVRIAFVNNSNDKRLLLIDNIAVSTPPTTDGSVKDITSLNRYTTLTSQTIGGTFHYFGFSAANNAVLNYKINNSTVTSQTFNFSTPLNYGAKFNYSFTSPGSTFVLGKNTVKVWVTTVNSANETNLVNDTAKFEVFVASQAPLRNALMEEFTSSTCGPCASLNVTFDPMLNSNNPNSGGRLNVIKNQVNWPTPGNDPSYNPHVASRVSFYGVNGAPKAIMNGHEMLSEDQAGVDAGKAEPAFATISATLTNASGVLTGSAIVTPYVTVSAANQMVIHQAILQKHYKYSGAVTSQKDYYHILRKMYPSAAGTATTTVDGTANNVTCSHTVTTVATPTQGTYDFWTETNTVYEYVVFLQDKISKDILQSGSAQYTTGIGMVNLTENKLIGIYPNPANDYAVVGIKLESYNNVDLFIYDLSGKLVYSQLDSKLDAGQHEIRVNTSSFAQGVYNVVVNTDKGLLNEKLIITK